VESNSYLQFSEVIFAAAGNRYSFIWKPPVLICHLLSGTLVSKASKSCHS